MPWATLELDPAVASERDVKRAYAKRLKTCRPDQDPEGFRKLHDAYTSALAQLQWREAGFRHFGTDSDSEDTEDDVMPSPATVASAPISIANDDEQELRQESAATPSPASFVSGLSHAQQAVADAFDRLETAITRGQSGVADLVRAAEATLYEYPDEVMRWGELMYELISKRGAHPELRLKPEAMLFELEHGGAGATLAVIERLDRDGSTQGIANLANLLVQNKHRIANPSAGLAAARLAGAATFWAKQHAAPLADFAYEHLARGERDYQMQLIDRHAAIRDLLYTVPDRFKSFWRQRIMHTPGKDGWDDEHSRAALRWLDSSTTRGSQIREVLIGLLPEEVAATLSRGPSTSQRGEPGTASSGAASDSTPEWDRPSAPRPVRPGSKRQWHYETTNYQSSNYQSRGSTGASDVPWGAIFWIGFVIVKVLFLSAKCSGGY